MKKINSNEVKEFLKRYTSHWVHNKLYIITGNETIVINDCPKEKYDLIISNYNRDMQEELKKKVIKKRPPKMLWEEWEINLIKEYKGNYNILKNLLPHRTKASIKIKSTRIFYGENI